MKYKPFKDLLANYKFNNEEKDMVTVTETTKKKHRSTKAHVEQAIKRARAYLRAHPKTTTKMLAEMFDISQPTLTRRLNQKRTYTRRNLTAKEEKPEKGARVIEVIDDTVNTLMTKFLKAKNEYQEARKALLKKLESDV